MNRTTAENSSLTPSVAHVVPLRVLMTIWGTLLVLTLLTVAAGNINLGPVNLWIALFIALGKASLVALYFMHLRYDHPLNALVLICALLFVILFVGLALMDAVQYQPELIPDYQPSIQGS